ncbi:MAG: hypothetical protein COT84_06105 [Chlamydiae bacterium CG10_big_fil_rev_8_21_14_0_10_35_9]|nr:MAG: hypothetical protein COT84_06105 [Chlamydiae bacterium CG10_big_fil_rev_8_21_14_0_10_35_9]
MIYISRPCQTLPSAFKIAEYPTYLCWQLIKSSENLWNKQTSSNIELYKNRSLAVLSGVVGFTGGIKAIQITIAATPITIMADLVVGAAECVFNYYHKANNNDVSAIAYRKLVISPCQQITFYLTSYFINTLAIPFWSAPYSVGQLAVGRLPKVFDYHLFNIFINGGSGSRAGEKWIGPRLDDKGRIINVIDKATLEQVPRDVISIIADYL